MSQPLSKLGTFPLLPTTSLTLHLHPFLPGDLSRAHYVVGTMLRYDLQRWKPVFSAFRELHWGKGAFVGDPVPKLCREPSATVQAWMDPEVFRRCSNSKEDMLPPVWRRRVRKGFREEETLRVGPAGGRLCFSLCHVRSGINNKILSPLPSRQSYSSLFPSSACLLAISLLFSAAI